MAERLADAVSPYLRSHAGNPVDWYPWGEKAFAAAAHRDVPLLVSIGYATCHWCHVMARETFSDPALAAVLNAGFVAVKVDREEHPEVDGACMTAAGAFTPNLGWPLNVFMTPAGRVFHAGTYSPPVPTQGQPSFRQVLEAVTEAWQHRRDEVESSAAGLAAALREAATAAAPPTTLRPVDLERIVDELVGYEDTVHGGFGGAPKFPVTPVLLAALDLSRSSLLDADRRERIRGVVERALAAMRDGGLRDAVEGGFFRYATRRDWSVPHYERMLVDNALLLRAYADIGDRATAAGIVAFLRDALRRPSGAFGSAQDSESDVDGRRTEGDYYALDAAARREQPAPAVDAKVLSGWNGLAIGALAHAGLRLGEPAWIALAESAADAVLAAHLRADGTLVRASLDGRVSAARATLEDFGALAEGLLELAVVSGRVEFASAARRLVEACRTPQGFVAPGVADPLLAQLGTGDPDTGEGAGPSGRTAIAGAAWRLALLTGDSDLLAASIADVAPRLAEAVRSPIGAGALLGLAVRQLEPIRQTVVVSPGRAEPGDPLVVAVAQRSDAVVAVVDEGAARAFEAAGFGLFEARTVVGGLTTAYLCDDFVCRLPITDKADPAIAEHHKT